MCDLESGIYTITNRLHRNHAALLNDNADESVRGVFPLDEETVRDTEKVSHSIRVAADRTLTSLCSGNLSVPIVSQVDTVLRAQRL